MSFIYFILIGLTTESLVSNLNSNDIIIDSQDLMEYLNTLAEQVRPFKSAG